MGSAMGRDSKGRHVIVLGAGIGGLSTVRALRQHLNGPDGITVIDRSSAHVQGLSLLWLLRGWRQLNDVVVDGIRGGIGDADLLQAEIKRIDLAERQVHTSHGMLGYDALVLALGAELHVGGVPGLLDAVDAGVAVHYYTPGAALAAGTSLRRVRGGRVVFMVCGIPYRCPGAPYEGALLAADLLTETGARDHVDLRVYTPEPMPMPVAGPVVGSGLVSMLAGAGIGFHPGRHVERVDPDGCEIVFTDGERVQFDLLVFVPPHRPPDPVAELGLSAPGWIPVDAHTLATAIPGVWALGDNASITLVNGKPLPKAAVFAKGQAAAVASGVARHLGIDVPEVRYNGHGHCYLEVGGHQAARGEGDFYAAGGPVVTLAHPSVQLHQDKEREESDWLADWT
jgi:sulfide:quinone oxidoreductase